jgi:hypothetical protein
LRTSHTNNDFEISDSSNMSLRRYRSESNGIDDHRSSQGTVVQYSESDSRGEELSEHEAAALAYSASRIAALKGYSYAGEYDPARSYDGPVYFVPRDTLIGIETARTLGIRTEDSLFGGVAPWLNLCLHYPLYGSCLGVAPGW